MVRINSNYNKKEIVTKHTHTTPMNYIILTEKPIENYFFSQFSFFRCKSGRNKRKVRKTIKIKVKNGNRNGRKIKIKLNL